MKINLENNKNYPKVGDIFKFRGLEDFYLLVQNEWDGAVCAVCLRTSVCEFTWDDYEEFIYDEKSFITSVISGKEIEIRIIEN